MPKSRETTGNVAAGALALVLMVAGPAAAQAGPGVIERPPPSGEVSVPDNSAGPNVPAVADRRATAGASRIKPSSSPPARVGQASTQPAGANESPFAGFEGKSNHGPININSDQLNLDYKNNSVLFTGHVHAVQAGSELTSDTLRVMYGKDFHQVQTMFADGNVRMSQDQRWATGEHAVLDETRHTVVLTGNPVVHDGRDQIAGTKITVFLQTGKSEVEQPKAVIFPREAKNQDNSGGAAGGAGTGGETRTGSNVMTDPGDK